MTINEMAENYSNEIREGYIRGAFDVLNKFETAVDVSFDAEDCQEMVEKLIEELKGD